MHTYFVRILHTQTTTIIFRLPCGNLSKAGVLKVETSQASTQLVSNDTASQHKQDRGNIDL